ncbi:MAG: hypothetical protein HY465_02465 [Deltaproteobacteria bacterium]|nr:hypothetical protein [Deltaproteobacteria bacterium]
MITLKTMPKQVVAELLQFMAEHETFERTTNPLGENFTAAEIKATLRELAMELLREAATDAEANRYDVKADKTIAPKVRKIISYLSPLEEQTLLKTFGVIEPS